MLSFVEWRSFGAAALADRAEAAAADEARDPVAAVYAALGADASGSSPGASAGYEALANLLTPESLAEDPGPFARALCVALDAASARIEAGDASENSVGKTHAMVEEWATSVFAMCDESAAVPPTAFPESSGADDDYTGTPLEEADEARVAEIEATAEEARVVFDAGAPEEVATNADADIVAAHERATAEYEAAKVAVETAVAAREDALTRAASRERAARRLTRLLPPYSRGAAPRSRRGRSSRLSRPGARARASRSGASRGKPGKRRCDLEPRANLPSTRTRRRPKRPRRQNRPKNRKRSRYAR